jgi:hypothetical protein
MTTRRKLLGSLPLAAAVTLAARSTGAGDATAPPLKFDVSVCLDSGTLLWVPLRLTGAPEGLMHRPLRRLDDGSLRSAVVRMPGSWKIPGPSQFQTQVQLFVTQGELRVGDTVLPRFGYAALPPGFVLTRLESAAGAEFLLVCDADPVLGTAPSMTAAGASATILPSPPTDRTTRLWKDERTGANTSLIVVPPKWEVEGPEFHPCQEEIFCVSGDIAPDDIRVLKTGWFLWNPPYGVHGWHLHSTAGGIVLEWHDRAWSRTVYRG